MVGIGKMRGHMEKVGWWDRRDTTEGKAMGVGLRVIKRGERFFCHKYFNQNEHIS